MGEKTGLRRCECHPTCLNNPGEARPAHVDLDQSTIPPKIRAKMAKADIKMMTDSLGADIEWGEWKDASRVCLAVGVAGDSELEKDDRPFEEATGLDWDVLGKDWVLAGNDGMMVVVSELPVKLVLVGKDVLMLGREA
jgi:hypothetical protein